MICKWFRLALYSWVWWCDRMIFQTLFLLILITRWAFFDLFLDCSHGLLFELFLNISYWSLLDLSSSSSFLLLLLCFMIFWNFINLFLFDIFIFNIFLQWTQISYPPFFFNQILNPSISKLPSFPILF